MQKGPADWGTVCSGPSDFRFVCMWLDAEAKLVYRFVNNAGYS